jgi:hypothetical protein
VRIGALVGAAAGHAVLARHLDAHPGALGGGTASAGEAQVQAAAVLLYYAGDGAELLLATALFGQWLRRRPGARPRSRAGRTSPATADPAAARRSPAAPAPTRA